MAKRKIETENHDVLVLRRKDFKIKVMHRASTGWDGSVWFQEDHVRIISMGKETLHDLFNDLIERMAQHVHSEMSDARVIFADYLETIGYPPWTGEKR